AYIISSSDKGQAAGLANLLGLGIALVEAFVIWWFITRLWPLSLKWLFIGPASNLCFNLVCRLPVQDNRDLANTLMSSFRESWGYEVAAIAYQVFTTLCFLMLATLPQSLLLRKHLGKWWLWWCGQYVAAKLFYMVFSWLVFQVLGGGSYQVVFYPLFSFISMALCLWIIYRRQHMAS
ncbi:MAG: hypothetical protein JNG86_16135, partial [Verrucomicrobiaceae bacterium]|nr:hypothetical protein [Verrucomicrobiaceae bacterium]